MNKVLTIKIDHKKQKKTQYEFRFSVYKTLIDLYFTMFYGMIKF
jgi:hypothetical protein